MDIRPSNFSPGASPPVAPVTPVAGVSARTENGLQRPAQPERPITPVAAGREAQPSAKAVQDAVDHANQVLEERVVGDLQFSIDKDTNIRVVKLIDRSSGDTVVQIPSAQMLKVAKSIDQFVGSIIQKTA